MQDFSRWKWRALHRRRPFYFSSTQLILAICWGSLYKHYLEQEGSKKQLFVFSAIIMATHACVWIMFTFSRKGSQIIHELQGERLCIFSCVSIDCFLLLCVTSPGEDSNGFVFALVSCFAVLSCQNLGLRAVFSWMVICFTFVLGIVFVRNMSLCEHLTVKVIVGLRRRVM